MPAGSAAQPGSPDTRSLKPATRPSQVIRPARWAIATQITSAVTAVATPVPQSTSPIGAPRAGSLPPAATVVRIPARIAPMLFSRFDCPTRPTGALRKTITRFGGTLNLVVVFVTTENGTRYRAPCDPRGRTRPGAPQRAGLMGWFETIISSASYSAFTSWSRLYVSAGNCSSPSPDISEKLK